MSGNCSGVKANCFTSIAVKSPVHEAKGAPKFHIRVAKKEQIPKNLQNVENLYLPLHIDENSVESLKNSGVSLGVEVPRGIFGGEKAVENLLLRAKSLGITIAYCSTLDGLALAKRLGFEIHTGFSMNTSNSLSVSVLENLGVKFLTLSPELTLKDLASIGGRVPRGIIAYGRLPLMLTRNCPIKNGKTCAECKGNSYLTDRMGKKFPVVCGKTCSFPGVVVSEGVYTGWFDCDPVPCRVVFDRGPELWAQPAFSCTAHSIVDFLAAPPPSLHP